MCHTHATVEPIHQSWRTVDGGIYESSVESTVGCYRYVLAFSLNCSTESINQSSRYCEDSDASWAAAKAPKLTEKPNKTNSPVVKFGSIMFTIKASILLGRGFSETLLYASNVMPIPARIKSVPVITKPPFKKRSRPTNTAGGNMLIMSKSLSSSILRLSSA